MLSEICQFKLKEIYHILIEYETRKYVIGLATYTK